MSHLAAAAEQMRAAAREVVDETAAALVSRIEALEARLDAALGDTEPGDQPEPEGKSAPRKRASSRKAPAPVESFGAGADPAE